MKTLITKENPHRRGRHAFAWEYAVAGGVAHLDFGCYDGAFLASLANKGIARLVGADASSEAVAIARQKYPTIQFEHCRQGSPLPFANGTFSSISLLDVIEHVYDQKALVDELCRVLSDDGTLIMTMPGRHLFSFLDLGNWKFCFPRLHRWFYCRRHTPEQYEQRYVANPDGLIGDISAQKRWHQHFRRSEAAALLAQSGLRVEAFDGAGFFQRLLSLFNRAFRWFGPLRRMIGWLSVKDHLAFNRTNLYCLARKAPRTPPPPTC